MTKRISRGRLWTARVMSWLVILFMLFDSISKLFKPAPVVEGTVSLGFAEHHIVVLGILGLISTILYIIPRTAFLGALLLTAYFGGAIAVQVRVDAPLFSNILFSVYLAILAWGGLWLKDERIRKLLPLSNKED
ncbi:DoxX family protein [Paenibacillus thalictri]|uniref:DoxX family protein n=1 Tax=Paenibacillus thalictri TaxID=2527873 RepID=A0A4Q9DXD8_9BACL|nr:DoxX family protein [Paenibacillus thalictri]TBL81076.1 DoxX family protein [Paenibacillus thalictri]